MRGNNWSVFFPTQTSSYLFEPCWEKALLLCSDLSCGEYANEGQKHLLFWLATSWLSCRQGPCIDCLMKLYCCLKNYQTLTDCAGYNWAAHSESWGEDLQATETVHKSRVNIGGAEAKPICLLTLKHLIHFGLSMWRSVILRSSLGQKEASYPGSFQKGLCYVKPAAKMCSHMT